MSFLAEIEKLKGKHFLIGLLSFLGTIGPGFLMIFHYRPELVEKYDIGKLLLFASSLTLPFIFACTLIYAAAVEGPDVETPSHAEGLKFGALLSAFILNSVLAIAYFANYSFKRMMITAIGVTAVILVIGSYRGAKALEAKKKAKLKGSEPQTPLPSDITKGS